MNDWWQFKLLNWRMDRPPWPQDAGGQILLKLPYFANRAGANRSRILLKPQPQSATTICRDNWCYNFQKNPVFFPCFSYMFAFLPLHEWIVMDLPSYWSWINFAVVIHIVTSWFFWQLVSEQRRKPDAMKTECKACNSIHQISSRLWPSVDAVQVIAMATEEFHLLLCRGIPQSTGQAVKRCHGIFGHLWSNMATSHPFFGDKAIVGSTGDGKIGWIWLDIAKKYLQIFIKPCVGVKILKAHQDFSHGLVLASCKSSTNFSRSHGHWPLFFSAATLKFWMLEASKSERSE